MNPEGIGDASCTSLGPDVAVRSPADRAPPRERDEDETSVAVQTSPLASPESERRLTDAGEGTFTSSSIGLDLPYDLLLTAGPGGETAGRESPYSWPPVPPPDPNARARERTRRTCQGLARDSRRGVSLSLQRLASRAWPVSKSLMCVGDGSP